MLEINKMLSVQYVKIEKKKEINKIFLLCLHSKKVAITKVATKS